MSKLRLFRTGKRPVYYVTWSEHGRSRRLSLRTGDKATALKKKAEFDALRQRPPEPDQQTVGALLDAYLADRKGRVGSYETLRHSADALRPTFGGCQPRHITSVLVRSFTTARRRNGLSDGTIRRDLGVLRAGLQWGVNHGWIESAPHIPMPGMPAARERWLTRDEANRLIMAAGSPHIKTFILLALYTGARRGAILELTWDRVDMDNRRIYYPVPGRAETKKRRTIVPINDTLFVALEESRQLAQSDWVIEHSGKPVKSVKTAFRNAVERAKLDDVRVHDLRRTCASWLLQAGVSFSETAAYLGDSEAMIRKVYGHFSPDWLKSAAEALEG